MRLLSRNEVDHLVREVGVEGAVEDAVKERQSSLDVEYIPRLTTKDVRQSRTKESDKADDSSATSHNAKIENAAMDSNVTNSEKAVQLVTCAKCNQEVPKKQWSKHNLDQHNNMAWRKDEEPLDFENDIKVKKVLALALKQKGKYLSCEKCEAIFRSVEGFISHMQYCGKSEEERQALMVTCPLCQAVMMPSSMKKHKLRYHRLEENENKEVNSVQMERTKQKAAEESNSEKAVQLVACAKCNQEVLKKQWSKHNLDQHNNMAWRKDEEPLDFENDIKLLKKVLALALKQKGKYLTCEKCEAIFRSVEGFISHMQYCGKSEEERQALMVTCPLCQAVMMPSSMKKHERRYHRLEENENKEVNNVQMERTKRKAAEESNSEKAVQLVTCAKCNQEVPKKQWSKHNLDQHNNMAWQKDEEPLDFENDIKLLKKVLALAVKQKGKYLTCEKCEAIFRSVEGFISHMQYCGKSEEERQALMVTCPLCQAVMMPSSMKKHKLRYHRLEKNENKEVNNVQMERTKRKAAEEAVPKILELPESLKEQNFSMNNVVQLPASKKKKIEGTWKVIEISKGVSCKQPGCNFTCSSYEAISEHYLQCHLIPEKNFMCKICKVFADSKDKIVAHMKEVHSGNNDLEKYSDYEIEEDENNNIPDRGVKRKLDCRQLSKISSNSTRTCRKMVFVDKETTQNPQSTETYKPALRWTLDFELKNYELKLFKDDMPNCFTLLENNDAAMYLPELTVSMAIKRVNVNSPKNIEDSDNDNWKRMNRFEGDIYEAVPTFFVGGPIWALAWLPIPSPMFSKNPTQYVAISTNPTMECKYNVRNKNSNPNIIQIWDVGPLNHQINNDNRSPILAYAIAHNSGTVWCLEWCPSGCYQDVDLGNYKADESKLKRMGLLAAACSDGCINIYSLPFADELKFEKTENNSWPIYKTDPVMTLVVNILMYENDKQDWQCTKLSWTKEHGHGIIAAGFTNGYIALWHLPSTSPLLLNTRRNTKFISASKHFCAHSNAITLVALVPFGNSRFLASASVDKSHKFWNLEDTSAPQSCLKKGIVSNGVWMTNWPCAVFSFDDALGSHYMHSLIVPLREYGYNHCPILATNSTTYGLAVSDHANSIAYGTLAGEVITIFPDQLLHEKKLLSKRQLNSFIKTVDFLEKEQQSSKNSNSKDKKNSKEYHYMPETYDECKDRFGIIFHDNFVEVEKNIASGRSKDSLNTDKLMSVPIEQYPFTSVNRMAWNPNARSYLWLATGYQNGLVRLLSLNFMSTPRELDTLLPVHVKSMLAKKEAKKEQVN